MSDTKLHATTPLGGYSRQFDGIEIAEIADRAIVSIAAPLGSEAALSAVAKTALGIALPDVGHSVTGKDGTRVIATQPGQWFAVFERVDDNPVAAIAGKLGDKAYYTDQSDAWAMLSIDGDNSRMALERICMLDLDDSAFATGAASRTVMEHLGALIVREDTNRFLLASARSSAKSFLHAVETSAANVS